MNKRQKKKLKKALSWQMPRRYAKLKSAFISYHDYSWLISQIAFRTTNDDYKAMARERVKMEPFE